MAMVYKFKEGSKLPQRKAQVVGERLEKIRQKTELTAHTVLDDAVKQNSPLHELFEWNDETAAEEYRLGQARHLLHSVVVELEGPSGEATTTRAFVVVTGERQNVYESVQVAMQDEDMRRQVLLRAWAELERWRKKYAELEDLAAVFRVMDQATPLAAAS